MVFRPRRVKKTEPPSKLFDNQVIAVEVEVDFSRESLANTTNGTRNGPCFTVGGIPSSQTVHVRLVTRLVRQRDGGST